MNIALEQSGTIPDKLFYRLPNLLAKIMGLFKEARERDIALLSLLASFGAVFKNVESQYYNDKVKPNIFVFITAPAANGKGALKFIYKLFYDIHLEFKEKSKGESRLFLPGDISHSGLISVLKDNDGSGLIFETEADELSNAFNQDWGNYSTLLRKAFQQEPITQYRKTDKLDIEIESPSFGVVLSGTPNQIPKFFRTKGDGLLSRFLFYAFANDKGFADVKPNYETPLLDELLVFSPRIRDLIAEVDKTRPTIFLNDNQWGHFVGEFRHHLVATKHILKDDANQLINRLALSTFKIILILTILRNESVIKERLYCEDDDFKSALIIAKCLIDHSILIFDSLHENDKFDFNDRVALRTDVLDKLNAEFLTRDFLTEFELTGIGRSQAYAYQRKWLAYEYIQKIKNGHFKRIK